MSEKKLFHNNVHVHFKHECKNYSRAPITVYDVPLRDLAAPSTMSLGVMRRLFALRVPGINESAPVQLGDYVDLRIQVNFNVCLLVVFFLFYACSLIFLECTICCVGAGGWHRRRRRHRVDRKFKFVSRRIRLFAIGVCTSVFTNLRFLQLFFEINENIYIFYI